MLDFGAVGVGITEERSVQLRNEGTLGLDIDLIGGSDPLATPFAIVSDACSQTTVNPGSACTIVFSFTPAAADAAAEVALSITRARPAPDPPLRSRLQVARKAPT